MPATKRIVAVVGALGLASVLMPITSAAADDCSGIMCLFKSRSAPADAPAAPPPVSAAGPAAPAAIPDAAPAAKSANADEAVRSKPKARPRPVAVVTIAAGPAEAARLKSLAAVMQKPRVKIVEAKSPEAADFAVTTPLDRDRGAEKAKLFTEEMHVVAPAKVQALSDLKGKVVSFGSETSPGRIAARKAFDALGIQVVETPLDLDNALDGLATGDVAAVVVLAPQPDARLKKLKASGLHLVSWPDNVAAPDGTVAATIDAGEYPGLAKPGDKVPALGVDAVLTVSQKGERQPAAKAFLGALSQHSATLSKRGFDLIKADLETRDGRRVANAEAR